MSTISEKFKSHAVGTTPAVTFHIAPGGRIIAHTDSLVEMHPDIKVGAEFLSASDRANPNRTKAGLIISKMLAGQLVTETFTNAGDEVRDVVIHPPGGGNVAWIDLAKIGKIKLMSERFLAATNDVDIGTVVTGAATLRGKQNGLMETVALPYGFEPDQDHHIFIESKGAIVEKTLRDDEVMHLHHNVLLAATGDLQIGLHKIESGKARWFSGEGRYLTELTGPGTYWLEMSNASAQSMGGDMGVQGLEMSIPAM